jgi:hypothetical protein
MAALLLVETEMLKDAPSFHADQAFHTPIAQGIMAKG